MKIFCGMLAALFAAVLTAAPLELVKEGKSSYVILVKPGSFPATFRAAYDLQEYIQKATGVKLQVVKKDKSDKPAIKVGFLKVDEPEGFIIKREGNDLHISGNDTKGWAESLHWSDAPRTGTWYGTSYFLRKFAGIRWFFPGEKGEYVPKSKNLIVEIDCIKKQPFMEYRQFGPIYFRSRDKKADNKQIVFWARRNGAGYSRCFNGSHAWIQHFKPEKLFKDHPDYFALVNGKRQGFNGYGSQMCTTNPKALDTFAETIIQIRKKHPAMQTLTPNDSGGFCECANCRALDTVRPDGTRSMTDRIATYCNEMARRVNKVLPDQNFGLYAYSYYADPPVKVMLNPHVTVMNVHNDSSLTYYNKEKREQHLKQLLGWRKMLARLYFYSYTEGMGGLDMPCTNAEAIKLLYQNLVKADVRGFSMNLSSSMGACGLNHYLYAQMSFDPLQDFDKLYADALQGAYGKSAALVRDYFADVENRFKKFVKEGLSGNVSLGYVRRIPDTFTKPVYAGLYEAWHDKLLKAEAQESDPGVKARLHILRYNLEYAENTRKLVLLSYDILKKRQTGTEKIDEALRRSLLREKQQKEMANLPDNHCIEYVKHRADQFSLALDSAVYKIMKNGGVRKTTAKQFKSGLELDGVLTEDFWKDLKFELVDSEKLSGKEMPVKAKFKTAVVGDELVIGFECAEPRMGALSDNMKKPGSNVWNENCVEIFIDPSGRGKHYFHVISNSLGTLYTEQFIDGKALPWESKVRAAAQHQKNSWSVEIAVPLKELTNKKDLRKANWGFNCARVRKTVEPQEYQLWSCTFGLFNVPGRFGRLSFK